jgi:hypothetical protein
MPYSNDYQVYYEEKTLTQIKEFILHILKGKQANAQLAVLRLLQKQPSLQQQRDIWERLELLLNLSSQVIKKEILKLLDIDNHTILKYLLEMYDDDSAEIRCFVFEKLCEIKNYQLIDPKTKVRLLFVGLSDNSPKVCTAARKFLKNLLFSLGVYKKKKGDLMDIDSEESKEDGVRRIESTREKIEKVDKLTSPIRAKKKLADSPSRIFDELDVIHYYNHAKYSATFGLITDAVLELTDFDNIIGYIANIVENLVQATGKNELMLITSAKKKDATPPSTIGKGNYIDKYALFNDIFFLQSKLYLILRLPEICKPS